MTASGAGVPGRRAAGKHPRPALGLRGSAQKSTDRGLQVPRSVPRLAMRLAQKGVDLFTIQKLLGHKSFAMTGPVHPSSHGEPAQGDQRARRACRKSGARQGWCCRSRECRDAVYHKFSPSAGKHMGLFGREHVKVLAISGAEGGGRTRMGTRPTGF